MSDDSTIRMAAALLVALVTVTVSVSVALTPVHGTIFDVSESDDGNLRYITYTGDYNFGDYCKTGSSDTAEFFRYLSDHVTCGRDISSTSWTGCSSFIINQTDGDGYYTGRNFDFYDCRAGIVFTNPADGYASVSTVDLTMFGDTDESITDMANDTRFNAVAYMPLDGINEKGVFICINTVINASAVEQNEPGKVDMFITSALRLVLDYADSTASAVELISHYNIRGPSNLHFFICDDTGDARTVEFVDSATHVTDTRLLTNHYITSAGRDVPATESSQLRYDTMYAALQESDSMTEQQVRDTMRTVMQNNSDHIHYSRWSVVYDLENLTAGICLRIGEDFHWEKVYRYTLHEPTGTFPASVSTDVEETSAASLLP